MANIVDPEMPHNVAFIWVITFTQNKHLGVPVYNSLNEICKIVAFKIKFGLRVK